MEIDTDRLTRLTVVYDGLAFERYGVSVDLHVQDDGRTLKAIVKDRTPGDGSEPWHGPWVGYPEDAPDVLREPLSPADRDLIEAATGNRGDDDVYFEAADNSVDWRVVFNKYRALIEEAEGSDYLPSSPDDGHYPPFVVPAEDHEWRAPYRWADHFTRDEWQAIFDEKRGVDERA